MPKKITQKDTFCINNMFKELHWCINRDFDLIYNGQFSAAITLLASQTFDCNRLRTRLMI